MSKRKFRGIWLAFLIIAATFWNPAPAWAANLQEVSTPAIISQLAPAASANPQIYITSPRADEILTSSTVTVNLQVTGTTLFKNATFGIGPHLHLLLDGIPSGSVYDLSQPIALPTLAPGTHTLQVLAAKPWHESWKNPGALTQVTFHVLAQSIDSPNPKQPRLVYSPPNNFGAEPFLLDFDLTNPPQDWQVRATINRQSFLVERWEPIYLKGLNPGANLIKLEYLDKTGQVLDSSIRVVNYQPNGQDGFSRLLRNEVPLADALALFDPNSRAVAVAPAQPQSPPSALPTPSTPPAPTISTETAKPNDLIAAPEIRANPQASANTEPSPREIAPVDPPPIVASTPPIGPTVPAIPAPAPVTPTPVQTPQSMPVSPVVPPTPPVVATVPSPLPTPTPVLPKVPKPTVVPPTPTGAVASPVIPADAQANANAERSPREIDVPVTLPTPPPTIAPPPVPSVPVAALPLPSPIAPTLTNPIPNAPQPLTSVKVNPPVAERPVELPVAQSPTSALNNGLSRAPETVPSSEPLVAPSPREIAAAPRNLAPQSGEEVVEFKVILRELFHTLGVRIKQATNQIPPLVDRWRKNFSHWIAARMQAMRAPQTAPDIPESPV